MQGKKKKKGQRRAEQSGDVKPQRIVEEQKAEEGRIGEGAVLAEGSRCQEEQAQVEEKSLVTEEGSVEEVRCKEEKSKDEERHLATEAVASAAQSMDENLKVEKDDLAIEAPGIEELRFKKEQVQAQQDCNGSENIMNETHRLQEEHLTTQEERVSTEAASLGEAGLRACAIEEIVGDYFFSNSSSNVECVLRIRPSGQWHHSAYRTSSERGRIVDPAAQRPKKQEENISLHKAYKLHGLEDEPNKDMDQFRGDYEEFEVWELAEAVGSWRQVQVRSTSQLEVGVSEVTTSGVLMTCENCTWKASHSNAPLAYCPSDESREEIESMFQSGQLVLCFQFSQCENTGQRQLKLHMDLSTVAEWTGVQVQELPDHVRIRSLQTSFQTLGFTRLYKGHAAKAL